jgi:hypothetical protein
MQITEHELAALNFYRACELHGGLILGQMVYRARDPWLATELIRHSAEEIVHAQLWTETILAVGGTLKPVRTTYQRRYAAAIGRPSSLLHVLIATQVFERRVYRHFLDHLAKPGTHPRVRETLRRMIEEEKHHLSWVREWLDRQETARGGEVAALIRRYGEVDAGIYDSFVQEYGWKAAA